LSPTEPTSRPSRQAGNPSVAPSKACGVLVVGGGINGAGIAIPYDDDFTLIGTTDVPGPAASTTATRATEPAWN